MLMEEVEAWVVVLCIGSSGARVGVSPVVVEGAETVVSWGRGCGMMVKGSGARACWGRSTKGFGS